MIGQTLRPRRAFPWASGYFLIVTLAVLVLGWRANPIGALLGALLPFSLMIAVWLPRIRPRSVQITEAALVVENGPTVAYEAIESIHDSQGSVNLGKTGGGSRALQILHRGGVLNLAPFRETSAAELCRFLLEQMSPSGSRDVGPLLDRFRDAQEDRYGKGQVRCYRARRYLGRGLRGRWVFSMGLAGTVTGLVWLAYGCIRPGMEGWAGGGGVIALVSILFALLGWFDKGETGEQRVRNWHASRLVVGPAGLAMIQGDVQGELAWHQVRDVQFYPPPKWLTITANQLHKGIHLHVEGASIVIADLYDRPLYAIFQAIQSCWMRYR